MKKEFLFVLAGCCLWALPAHADEAAVLGRPSVFWHDGEWQTFENGTWMPYGQRAGQSNPSGQPSVQHVQGQSFQNDGQLGGIGQLNSIGQPPAGFGQPPAGFGQTPSGLGQPPTGLGQQPSGLGQPNGGLGQTTIGMGQPNGIGQPTTGMGRTTIGIGQPNSSRPPASLHNHLRPSSNVGKSAIGNNRSSIGTGHGNSRKQPPQDSRRH